ncbi:oxidoreductase [Aspergillus avenaceus]|uniref:Oxidoreductase n=1 Tax=Aspergillus avenaceus TaxID=36643 RepID=A0A5N6TCT4_ASPAV|nr:oxidoreductase [Aspergillus avenaceus]
MKPKISTPGFFLRRYPSSPAHVIRRHYVSTSSPFKQRRPWLRVAVVTIAATGLGAYVRSRQENQSTTLNPLSFTPYSLISKEPVSSSGSIFTLKAPRPDSDNERVYEETWETGIWSVMFKQPQLQIGRDYTPLPPLLTEDGDEATLRFYIRRDPFGEMSRYLHGLEMGATVEMRGPQIECEIPEDTQRILFIAGGTGIAPALQAGHTLLRRTNEVHKPTIHILWANRRRDDCAGGHNNSTMTSTSQRSWFSRFVGSSTTSPAVVENDSSSPSSPSLVVKELEALRSQYPEQVTVDYFVDEENTFIGKKEILNFAKCTSLQQTPKRNMILVSGPEGFISYMAGPKVWAQGMELQGSLQGIIKELNLHEWMIWKL